MSAAEALGAAHAAGVTVTLDGEGLLLEALAEPPQSVIDALSRYKLAIVELLRRRRGGWTAEDWRVYFDKRGRIMTSNTSLPRAEAQTLVLSCCVTEWLNQHPAASTPGRCAWCGRAEDPSAVVLPFGTEPGTHTWLHAECWRAWHVARKADAIEALAAMGIDQPRTHR
jgi:hypothetical protein